jgi:hypothetical protein
VKSRPIRRVLFLTALIAMFCDHTSAVAQNRLWREIKQCHTWAG